MPKITTVQFNIQLNRGQFTASQSARLLFSRLAPELKRLRFCGSVSDVFFQRKPPDIRLRITGAEEVILKQIVDVLDFAESENQIASFAKAIYEPEHIKLGGPHIMPDVHKHWSDDTDAWMQLVLGRPYVPRKSVFAEVSIAMLNDLFFRTLQDPGEVCDVWHNVSFLSGMRVNVTNASLQAKCRKPSLGRLRATALEDVLNIYEIANRTYSLALLAAFNEGKLNVGLRALLAHHAIFHFNRFGFGARWVRSLSTCMEKAWDPHAGLRGVASRTDRHLRR